MKKIVFILSLICIFTLVSCATPAIEVTHTTPETTEVPIETNTLIQLPPYTVADTLLGTSKILTINKDSIILTTNLGIEKIVTISRTDMSISTRDTMIFIEVTFKDKTGQTITINLSTSDYSKVMEWLN